MNLIPKYPINQIIIILLFSLSLQSCNSGYEKKRPIKPYLITQNTKHPNGINILKEIIIKHDDFMDDIKLGNNPYFQIICKGNEAHCAVYHYPSRSILKYIVSDSNILFIKQAIHFPDSLKHHQHWYFSWIEDGNYALTDHNSFDLIIFDKDDKIVNSFNTKFKRHHHVDGVDIDQPIVTCKSRLLDHTIDTLNGKLFFTGMYDFSDFPLSLEIMRNVEKKIPYGLSFNKDKNDLQFYNIRFPKMYTETDFYSKSFFVEITPQKHIMCSFKQSDSLYLYDNQKLQLTIDAGIYEPHEFIAYDRSIPTTMDRLIRQLFEAPWYKEIYYDPYRKTYLRGYKHAIPYAPNGLKKPLECDIPFSYIILNQNYKKTGEFRLPKSHYLKYREKLAFCPEGIWSLNSNPQTSQYKGEMKLCLFNLINQDQPNQKGNTEKTAYPHEEAVLKAYLQEVNEQEISNNSEQIIIIPSLNCSGCVTKGIATIIDQQSSFSGNTQLYCANNVALPEEIKKRIPNSFMDEQCIIDTYDIELESINIFRFNHGHLENIRRYNAENIADIYW